MSQSVDGWECESVPLAAVLARIAAYPVDFTTDIPARDGLYLLAGCALLPPTPCESAALAR